MSLGTFAGRKEYSPAETSTIAVALPVTRPIRPNGPRGSGLFEEQRQAIVRRSDLTVRKGQLEVEAELASGGVVFFSAAEFAEQSSSNGLRNVGLGTFAGIMAGTALAYFLALRRRRFDRGEEPSPVVDAPLLGVVPDFRSERLQSLVPARDAPRPRCARNPA